MAAGVPRRFNRVASVAWPDFQYGHPGQDAVPDWHLLGRLDHAPEGIIDEIGQELGHRELVKVPEDAHSMVQSQP